MVDALRRAHGWLQAAGSLVDIRPTAEPGPNARHARADTALAVALERRWFVSELRLEFSFHRYADRIAEVRDHVRDDWIGASIDDEALERAARLQGSEPGARLRIREQIGIGRVRPIRR